MSALGQRPRRSLRCLGFLNGLCGVADHVQHSLWLGEHRDVTGAQLDGCGAHALCNEALQFGLDGAIFSGHDFDAPGRLPSFASLYAALWNESFHSTLMLAPRITLPHFLVY